MKKLLAMGCILLLAACGGPPDVSHYPKAPFSGVKIGKPYKINGKWYSPHYDPHYDETGVASWYGPGFHGKNTANGERYNQHGYTAAHTTLPLPSIVRVTNLENGRAINVRVNDRGPFHDDRIIDLSKSAAKKLGVVGSGTAKVRVQYLQAETERFIASKGKQGDELRYSTQFAAYEGLPAIRREVIRQDLEIVSIEKVGTRTSAPLKTVEIVSLEDITPQKERDIIAQRIVETKSEPEEVRTTEFVLPTSRVQSAAVSASWVIQVASYADTVNAERMMQKLSGMGKTLVQEVAVRGQPYYRVLLKPESSGDNHYEAMAQLQQRFGIQDARLIEQ